MTFSKREGLTSNRITASPFPFENVIMKTLFAVLLLASTVQAQDLSGKWHGCWTDNKSGHTGKLHGNFECQGGSYRVVFTGTFAKIVPFRFVANLQVTGQEGDTTILSGTQNIPFMGPFTYHARATNSNFAADYSSRRWEGQFLLSR